MKILYTTREGGILKPLEINPEPDTGTYDIFAIYLPDGTIWDHTIGVDNVTKLTPEEFNELYQKLSGD